MDDPNRPAQASALKPHVIQLGDVFEFVDLPLLEYHVADLKAAGQGDELTFELPAVLQDDEHDAAPLRE